MPIRLSGMVSNMDTDSMVKELVKASSAKKDDLVKAQTKLSWSQDAWKTLNKKVYSLYSGKLSNMRFSADYSKKTTTVSDTTKATVIAGDGAVDAAQSLAIKQLAKAAYLTGGKIEKDASGTAIDASGSTTLAAMGITGTGSFVVNNGGKNTTIDLTETMTFDQLAAKIADTGLSANFDATNNRFFVSAKTSGADNNFSFGSATGNGATAMNLLGLDTTSTTVKPTMIQGQNAEIFLNGAKFSSASNTFSVNGLTITANEVTGVVDGASIVDTDGTDDYVPADDPANYNTVSLSTQTDYKSIYNNIKSFLKEYNTLITEVDKLYNADSAKGYEPLTSDEKEAMSDSEIEQWETKIKDALFRRDETLGSISNTMKNAMAQTYTVDGQTKSLSSYGINTLGYFLAADNEKGVYHIAGDTDDSSTSGETDKLMAAIAKDPEGTAEFFQKLSAGVYKDLGNKMKSTPLRSAYTVYNDKQMATEYSDYTKKIAEQEKKLTDLEDRYYAKFSEMEQAMSKLNSSTSAISSLLGG